MKNAILISLHSLLSSLKKVTGSHEKPEIPQNTLKKPSKITLKLDKPPKEQKF